MIDEKLLSVLNGINGTFQKVENMVRYKVMYYLLSKLIKEILELSLPFILYYSFY